MKYLYSILLTITLSITISCTKTVNNDAELAALHSELDRLQQENDKLSKTQPIKAESPTGEYSDGYLKNFCSFAKPDMQLIDVFPYVSLSSNLEERYGKPLRAVAPQFVGCEFKKMLVYDYPFDLAEYKVDTGYAYVQAIYDKELKVTQFSHIVSTLRLSITMEMVKARDGVELTTYTVAPAGLKRKLGAVLLRTPYMTNGYYLNYARLALGYGKAFVLQANRGSHSSGGKFKWLDSVNVDDGEDTVSWITKQGFSNGKVIAWGISYDGYNALATAGNSPKGLSSVIACSAPANAATDSFTSNRFVEKYIFSYISTDRVANNLLGGTVVTPLINIVTEKKLRAEIDNLLLGEDLDEWNELSRAIDDQQDVYWSERSLYKVLSQTTVPILHVAGLHKDQDGRDTLLAFDYIQKNSILKDNHYRVLHKDGHGCGDANKLAVYKKMMDLADTNTVVDLSVEQKIHQFIKTVGDYVSVTKNSELPIKEKTFDYPQTMSMDDFYYSQNGDINKMSSVVEIPVTEAMILNGAPQLKVHFTASAPQVPVYVYLQIVNGQTTIETGWRTAFITGDEINITEEKTLTFPLMHASVSAGSKIIISMSTVDGSSFYRQPEARELFKPVGTEVPSVKILAAPGIQTQLSVPIEI